MSQYSVNSRGREVQKAIAWEKGIALDGISMAADLFLARDTWSVDSIDVVYTAAANISGVSKGVVVVFGTPAAPTKIATWNSLTSATLDQIVSLNLNTDKRVLSEGDLLKVRTFGPLQGAGMISVYVYLSRLR
jgi:hypothetical protein